MSEKRLFRTESVETLHATIWPSSRHDLVRRVIWCQRPLGGEFSPSVRERLMFQVKTTLNLPPFIISKVIEKTATLSHGLFISQFRSLFCSFASNFFEFDFMKNLFSLCFPPFIPCRMCMRLLRRCVRGWPFKGPKCFLMPPPSLKSLHFPLVSLMRNDRHTDWR